MIQSILFDRNYYDINTATKWLLDHGYKTSFRNKPLDVKPLHIRARQMQPKPEYTYITKPVEKGIEYIIITNYKKGGKLKNNKIPYETALKISNEIINDYKKKGINLIVVGSIARKLKEVGDLDFITSDNIGEDIKWFRTKIDLPDGKKIGMDIWLCDKDNIKLMKDIRSYPTYYIIAIRKGLDKIGYFLSDQELFDDKGKQIEYKNMKQLSELADVKYHPLSHYYEIK